MVTTSSRISVRPPEGSSERVGLTRPLVVSPPFFFPSFLAQAPARPSARFARVGGIRAGARHGRQRREMDDPNGILRDTREEIRRSHRSAVHVFFDVGFFNTIFEHNIFAGMLVQETVSQHNPTCELALVAPTPLGVRVCGFTQDHNTAPRVSFRTWFQRHLALKGAVSHGLRQGSRDPAVPGTLPGGVFRND